MPHFQNKGNTASSHVPEKIMDEIISRSTAEEIYLVINRFGGTSGFEKYYREDDTYRSFTDRLVKSGLIIKQEELVFYMKQS